jgi:predicted nucleic acid-binding protein
VKNVTITLDEETARWARIEAARRDLSVSRFIRNLLRENMRQNQTYELAQQHFLSRPIYAVNEAGAPYPNVLVHARDPSNSEKHARAQEWLAHLWRTRRGLLSFQVLNEYYAVATRKLRPGVKPEDARRDVLDLLAWQPQPVDGDVLQAAWGIEDRFGFAFWDALVIAAAQAAGSRYLLTEDLQHGQELDGMTVLSPFLATPAEVA